MSMIDFGSHVNVRHVQFHHRIIGLYFTDKIVIISHVLQYGEGCTVIITLPLIASAAVHFLA